MDVIINDLLKELKAKKKKKKTIAYALRNVVCSAKSDRCALQLFVGFEGVQLCCGMAFSISLSVRIFFFRACFLFIYLFINMGRPKGSKT
jgi:hypothetical protein